jgi:preprotein translocase subunit SecF
MIDLVGKRYWFFLISLLVILPGLVSLAIFGVPVGIDFTGGTLWEVQLPRQPEPAQVKAVFARFGYGDAVVQTATTAAGEQSFIIRSREIPADSPVKAQIEQALSEEFGTPKLIRFDSVGPTIAAEIVQRAAIAVGAASVGILLYIWWAFRRLPHAIRYGTSAIVAMLHDVLVVLGVFSLVGRSLGFEVDSLFVTAVLTVIGFSVHDTIVVFDRIRENMGRYQGLPFADIVNFSLVQTLVRSLNTSLTVIFTLVAMLLFGGVTIKGFVFTLLVGIITGTYSSIFNASMLLVVWETGELGRLLKGGTARKPEVARQ